MTHLNATPCETILLIPRHLQTSRQLMLHSVLQSADRPKEGAVAEDGTLEEEAFVAELAEVDLAAHRLLLHYQDAQHHLPDPLEPAAPHQVVLLEGRISEQLHDLLDLEVLFLPIW